MASLFLSHSSHDNEVAADLSRRLKEHGYDSLFLDFDPDSGIKGGRDWERELYRNLKLSRAVIVLCSPASMASRWCFVEIAQAKALGKAIFPITISPCRVESILGDRQVIDLPAVGADEAYRRLFEGLRAAGLDPVDSLHWDPRRPPYPGLSSFEAADAGIYFGREDEVRRVIEALTRLRRQGDPRLLVVVGSSGSGKSSLVRAGVLPRLAKDRPSWALLDPFRLEVDPLRELARSLSLAFPEGPSRPDWRTILGHLKAESREPGPAGSTSALTEYADDLTMQLGHREASMLVVVDQAEQLLQGVAGDEASAFLQVLRRATERPGGRVLGLLTLRSDFLGSFQNHPALRGVPFADLPLGLLPVENFPQVIEGPADRAEIALEPGLVGSMIADARAVYALPLLAFTLREMYERCRDQERLTLKVYRDDLGGIQGAVARVVERIKSEAAWTPEVGRALRRAFLKLVRVNDEGQFTRQPCRWADLPDQAAPVLEAFVKARLLSTNGDVVEVTHESLFRVWPELAGWLDEGRELFLWRKNLQDEVEAWIAHDHDPLYLLSGARVAEGRRWLASNLDDFPQDEAEFIAASLTAEDDRIARERSQQEKLRWLARCLAVAAVVASLMGVYALSQRNEANTRAEAALKAQAEEKSQRLIAEKATKQAEFQARVATSRRIAALSVAELDGHLDRSLLLAVAAFRAENTREARESLYNAVQDRPRLASYLHVNEKGVDAALNDVKSVAFSPDGKSIAAGFWDRDGSGVVLWDVAARKRLGDAPLPVAEGYVNSVAFSPDGKTIAGGFNISIGKDDSGGVVLWDVHTRRRLGDAPLSVAGGDVESVAFSPDGKILAAGFTGHGGGDGGVALWDVDSRERLGDLPLGVTEDVHSVAFSPDGKSIAAGVDDTVVMWDLGDRSRLGDEPLSVPKGTVKSVAFSPDGKIIAAGFGDRGEGGVMLWGVAARTSLNDAPLSVAEGAVESVAFSPDGKCIAAGFGGGYGGVVLWNVDARERRGDVHLPVSENDVHGVAFSPDGKCIAAGFGYGRKGGGGAVLVNVVARVRQGDAPLTVPEGFVRSVAFSPEGKSITARYGNRSGDGLVTWDVNARERLLKEPFTLEEGELFCVAFSPGGKTSAAGYRLGREGSLALWDVAAHRRLGDSPLHVAEGFVRIVAFSPDGKTIAAGYLNDRNDSGVVLWDLAARKRLGDSPLHVAGGVVVSLAFSPDGKTIAAGIGGDVVLWDVVSRKRIGETPLAVAEGDVEGVAFSPDGKTIAAGFRGHLDGGVVLWNLTTRERSGDAPLSVSEGEVHDVAFSPDGKIIAAGFAGTGGDGVVLWDVNARERLVNGPLPVAEGSFRGMTFSPDGKTIAATYLGPSSGEGGLLLLDVDLESWLRIAGRIANRNFTWKEWRDYFPETPYHATFPDLPIPPEASPK